MAGLPSGAGRIGEGWSQLSLAVRFAVASGAVLILAALAIRSWVTAILQILPFRNRTEAALLARDRWKA